MTRVTTFCGVMATAAALAGCMGLGQAASRRADLGPGQVEAVHAAAIAQDQAVFWVASNGCTRKADLTPVVRSGDGGSIISLRRIKDDRCHTPLPEGVELRWTFQEMGLQSGARVSIENPYQLPRG